MRTAVVLIVAAAATVGLSGCRAEAKPPDVEMGGSGLDMAVSAADDMVCPRAPEVCGNGCDDDRNGYTDDDDPACTSQLLVTVAVPPNDMATVDRLILGAGAPALKVLDGHAVTAGAMATYKTTFGPSIYLVSESSRSLERLDLDGGLNDNSSLPFALRDVCIFNGELIVVEPIAGSGGRLHRFKPDASTEISPPLSIDGHLSACTSDGEHLYVSRYLGSSPSEIVEVAVAAGGSGLALTGNSWAMPARALADAACCPAAGNCCDRLVDFAWIAHTRSFVGLFATGGAGSIQDVAIDTSYLASFGLDGGMGPWLDAGTLHGVGDFVP